MFHWMPCVCVCLCVCGGGGLFPPPSMLCSTSLMFAPIWDFPSVVPRPPRPAFVACSTKSGEKAWTDLSHNACRC